MRALEQIRNHLGYMGANVKLVGATAGLAMGHVGNAHYSIEDIALMRVITNMTVISPADAAEAVKSIYAVCESDGPCYIRHTGNLNCPVVYREEFDFRIGKANILRDGGDAAIIACGTMVFEALRAAAKLEGEGVSCGVVDMHTIKPLDTSALDTLFARCARIVTVEEHSVVGGLGSAVAEYKASFADAPPQLILGLPDMFGIAADQGYLLDKYGLTADKIAEQVKEFIC
jgi:transketolase